MLSPHKLLNVDSSEDVLNAKLKPQKCSPGLQPEGEPTTHLYLLEHTHELQFSLQKKLLGNHGVIA